MMPNTRTLQVRSLDPAVADRLSKAAAARQMTLAQYLTALVALHDRMRVLPGTHQGIQADNRATCQVRRTSHPALMRQG